MKIIDLLNRIANGEEVPKKIKYDYNEWEYDEKLKTYYCGANTLLSRYKYICLNDEVEILELEKKIPEKINIFKDDDGMEYVAGNNCEKISYSSEDLLFANKINGIIDYLKSKGDE